jgi:hypothetical protein
MTKALIFELMKVLVIARPQLAKDVGKLIVSVKHSGDFSDDELKKVERLIEEAVVSAPPDVQAKLAELGGEV